MQNLGSDALQQEPTLTEKMDQLISSFGGKLNGSSICRIIDEVFKMDLTKASLLDKTLAKRVAETASSRTAFSEAAIDLYMKEHGICTSGAEVRSLLNQLYGINLQGISALHQQRISLYSKEQWIVRNPKDLFIVHTGKDDIDAQVMPAPYFMEKTGLDRLPEALQRSLSELGYSYNEDVGAYYFANPDGQAVSGDFKRGTMGAIHNVIQEFYAEL